MAVIVNPQAANSSSGISRNSFCIPLVCGLFLGNDPIPLSGTWGVGGLRIEIQLAPDSNVLFSADNTDTTLLNAYYQLKNVRLICETRVPAPDQLSSLTSNTTNTFVYNSITSFYQTINSTNATLNFNLALSKVLGVFMNIVPSSHINSLTRDGLASLPFTNSTGAMAKVKQAVFTRGGERYPLQYNLDTLQKTDLSNNIVDSAFARIGRTSVTPQNVRYTSMADNFLQAKQFIQGGSQFGLGVSYDSISDQGIDFSTVPFGVQLELDLTTDSPNSIFLFVHSRQTVLSSPNGIQLLK